MLVQSSYAAVETLKNSRLFGWRVMLQKQEMAVKCEYYSEDPSARCMLAPNWPSRRASAWPDWDLPDFFGPLTDDQYHRSKEIFGFKRFNITVQCLQVGKSSASEKPWHNFGKSGHFLKMSSSYFGMQLICPGAEQQSSFPVFRRDSRTICCVAKTFLGCENSSLIRFKDATVLATFVCFL